MDAFWMFGAPAAAVAAILPTMFANLFAIRYTSGRQEKLVTGAMNCWLAMNVAWMVGEIFELAAFYVAAKVLTVMGFVLLLAVAAQARRAGVAWYEQLRQFRRLRIPYAGGRPD